jgi:hypothetical protein
MQGMPGVPRTPLSLASLRPPSRNGRSKRLIFRLLCPRANFASDTEPTSNVRNSNCRASANNYNERGIATPTPGRTCGNDDIRPPPPRRVTEARTMRRREFVPSCDHFLTPHTYHLGSREASSAERPISLGRASRVLNDA